MAKARTLVGLDVHATRIVAASVGCRDGRAGVLFDDGGLRWCGRVLCRYARCGAGGVRGGPDRAAGPGVRAA